MQIHANPLKLRHSRVMLTRGDTEGSRLAPARHKTGAHKTAHQRLHSKFSDLPEKI